MGGLPLGFSASKLENRSGLDLCILGVLLEMSQVISFADVVEAADRLSSDEQLELISILKRRMAEAGRARILRDIAEGREEFARGECPIVSVDELMREILE